DRHGHPERSAGPLPGLPGPAGSASSASARSAACSPARELPRQPRCLQLLAPDLMRLTPLGHLELHDGDVPYLARRRKELVLLAVLSRHAPLAVGRERLVELLWEGRDPARARHSLRQALTDLRRVLGKALVVTAEEVALAPGAVELDAGAFVTACVRHDWDTAVSLWRGTFLDGAEDVGGAALAEWLGTASSELESLFFDACERRCRKAEGEGRWTDALSNAELWLRHAPESGPARARLTTVLRSLGRRAEADRLNGIERDVTTSLREPDFAGRTEAFDLLARAWDMARTGNRQVVVVRGTNGSGRSRLLREFARLVAERWPRSAVRRMSETPFPDAPTLILADVVAQPEMAPAVVDWLAQPAQRCLLVVTLPPGRTDLAGIDAAMRSMTGVAHLELGPLSLAETHQVVRSMVPLPNRLLDFLARRLHADTEGHPATLVRALTLLVSEGMLACDSAAGWRTTPGLGVAPLALDDPAERAR